ncbi:MAG: DUF1839 family protein [Frankiales bacterium]|nr:DUF1839 family protein [Frankiales bacterium]
MHSGTRTWTETNCYADVWIELLHDLGLDPVPAFVSALSADFQGDQWVFLKVETEDLRDLYGITVGEMNVWRPVRDHVVEQLAMGRRTTVEVDSWWLPDTAGVSYRLEHVKTTIVPTTVDVEGRRMRYLHSAGHHVLEGEDFDHVFDLRAGAGGPGLPPYMEVVRLDRLADPDDLPERTAALARRHVARRPDDNPVERLAARLVADLPWLREQGLETFHQYAFGMIRQCGVTAELAADVVDWLTEHGQGDLGRAASLFREASSSAKTLQFRVARAVSGRDMDVPALVRPVAEAWGAAMADVVAWAEPARGSA